jgi:hypothetical protein
MKKSFLFFIFIPLYSAVYSQELIVINTQDSIQNIYFTKRPNNRQPDPKKNDYAHFRIAIATGYSRRYLFLLGDDDKEIKNGRHYGIELNYYFNKSVGIGLNYYAGYFNSAAYPINKDRVQHIIPTFCARDFDKQKQGGFLMYVGIGYVRADYKDDDQWIQPEWTIGLLGGVGYDFPLFETIALYIQASYLGDLAFFFNDKRTETFGRLNLSVGLRFAD